MKLFSKHTKTLFTVLIVSFSLAITSCSNPAGTGEEEHLVPVGAVLFLNGQEIARSENETGNVEGNITVPAGEETALITIRFIAEDGELFQPQSPEFSLGFGEEIDTSIAEVEQHAEDGKWRFHIVGISEGETELVLQLQHGEDLHSDFATLPVPIIVTSN